MKKIFILLLTFVLLLVGTAFAEPSVELDNYPVWDNPAVLLTTCEPFEIEGFEVLELIKIAFTEPGPIDVKISFVTEFTGNEEAMVCFETGGGLECWIFDDAIFEDNSVMLHFEEDLIEAASKTDTYLAIAKVISVG